jgi:hypothetical protein
VLGRAARTARGKEQRSCSQKRRGRGPSGCKSSSASVHTWGSAYFTVGLNSRGVRGSS